MLKGSARASPGLSAPPTAEASGAVGQVNRWLPDTRRRVEAALRGTATLKVSELLAGELRDLAGGFSERGVMNWALGYTRQDACARSLNCATITGTANVARNFMGLARRPGMRKMSFGCACEKVPANRDFAQALMTKCFGGNALVEHGIRRGWGGTRMQSNLNVNQRKLRHVLNSMRSCKQRCI